VRIYLNDKKIKTMPIIEATIPNNLIQTSNCFVFPFSLIYFLALTVPPKPRYGKRKLSGLIKQNNPSNKASIPIINTIIVLTGIVVFKYFTQVPLFLGLFQLNIIDVSFFLRRMIDEDKFYLMLHYFRHFFLSSIS
jgi:hypothetical protein